MAPERVLEHLKRRLPHFEADGPPALRSADARADVWQVPGRPASVVVKTAAGRAADMAADGPPGAEAEASAPASLLFEARSLEVLGPTGALAGASAGGWVRRMPAILRAARRPTRAARRQPPLRTAGSAPGSAQTATPPGSRQRAGQRHARRVR